MSVTQLSATLRRAALAAVALGLPVVFATGAVALAQSAPRQTSVVREAQEQLQSRGYDPGPATGAINPKTQSAIRLFQKDSGLPATGRLDAKTQTLLGLESAPAAAAPPPNRATKTVRAPLGPSSFSAKGLNYETSLTAIYLGDFEHARLDREGLAFVKLLQDYLNAYGVRCASSLPANRVEITTQECDEWLVERDGFGNEVGRECTHYEDRGTNVFADPQLYALYRRTSDVAMAKYLRETGGVSLTGGMRGMDSLVSVGGDMAALLQLNACGSPGLKRFEDNLTRFATGQPPLRLPNGDTLASLRPKSAPDAPFKDADYVRLVDDLIFENSRAWMANQYVKGSAGDVVVRQRDAQGRPAMVEAKYRFDSFGRQNEGSVKLRFTDGRPECLFFFDFPNTCREANPRIVTAYENGVYAK